MKAIDMAHEAAKAMAEPGTVGVLLTIPKGGMPKGFPRGELLNEMERDGRVQRTYHFKPDKVLAWLAKQGLIEMEITSGNKMILREISKSGALMNNKRARCLSVNDKPTGGE